MIINSILSLAFLWSWKKCHQQLKDLQSLRRQIATSTIVSVTDAVSKLKATPKGKKIFMVVKGLIELKVRLMGQRSLYSIVELKEIRQGKLAQHLMRRSWQQLLGRAFWKQPHNFKHLSFNLQDMNKNGEKLAIVGCREASLSGALNEVYKDRNITESQMNIVFRIIVRLYNFFASRMPFNFILPTTKVGEQLTLYSIQQRQFALVIGQFQKIGDEIVCSFPKYVTKQKSYVQSRILKKEKRLMFITFLLGCLLVITGIRGIQRVWEKIKQWRIKKSEQFEYAQDRSENQGQNCNCIICYVNVRNIVFKPCRHYAICKSCLKQLPRQACPYCKEQIQDTIEIVKKK